MWGAQAKTLFTAIAAWYMLGKRLTVAQWIALAMLVCGTSLVSLDLRREPSPHGGTSKVVTGKAPKMAQATPWLGVTAALSAGVLSSLSSVYFELLLKTRVRSVTDTTARAATSAPSIGLWVRNLQLSCSALPIAAVGMVLQDGDALKRDGLLVGFTPLVWCVVLLSACGGLLVAATMRYADNVVKCIALSLSILTSTAASIPLFGFQPTSLFWTGASYSVSAVVLYSWAPPMAVCNIESRAKYGITSADT